MCGFCSAATLKDDCGEDGFGSVSADLGVIENTIPGDTSTTETIAPGETREETLEVAGDTDWFAIEMTAGDAIQIDLVGVDHDAGNGLPDLNDPLVRIYDENGNLLDENDDIAFNNRDSQLQFVAEDTGTYYIEVAAYNNAGAGDYSLEVQTIVPPPPSTPLDALRGNKTLNDDDTLLVYFAVAGDIYQDGSDTYTASGMTQYEIDQFFSIFESIEEFADIDFEITTIRADADLELATATLPSSPSGTLLGFFNFPTFSGQGGFGIINNAFTGYSDQAGGSMDTGGFMYGVAVHEFGHGLGLGHPHDTGNGSDVMDGVSGSSDSGDFGLNQAVYTAMSYIEGSDIAGVAASDANTGHGATFAALDIAVLQEYYGANTTHASGDDSYTLFDSNDTGSGAGYYAIWDTGGTDTFEYTGSKDAVIDLREATLEYENGGGGFISYVDGVIGGFTIANGVEIENAASGAGDDRLVGNGLGNDMRSGDGNDVVAGFDGADTIRLGSDDDLGYGGSGDDEVFGNSGNDEIRGSTGNDDLRGQKGNDTVRGGGGDDKLSGGKDDDLVVGGGGNDTLTGADGNDTLRGSDGDDTFEFSDGTDEVDGYDALSDNERIDLSDYSAFADLTDLLTNHISQVGADVLIDDLAGNTMLILDTNLSDIDGFEFLF